MFLFFQTLSNAGFFPSKSAVQSLENKESNRFAQSSPVPQLYLLTTLLLFCTYVQTATNPTMAFYKKQNKIPLNRTTVNRAHFEKNWKKNGVPSKCTDHFM
ncbi:hypothetical protein CDAR_221011 [Caerostris darwini]|uniref:Uncharacterized protein n=1 Tax=Caerostris darwini TaxID=1538125 RepID=A0AAV4P5C9_9ARAC|nr:hypothetical protein CDAR_221011 [Caerostris darwini]